MSRRRGAWGALAGLLIALAVAAPHPARAHARSVSWSSWELDGRDAHVVLRVDQLELTRLPWGTVAPAALDPSLGAYLTDALRLTADGAACPVVDGPRALAGPPERAVVEWRMRCPSDGARRIESTLLREVAPSHLHFARVRVGGRVVEGVLGQGDPEMVLPSADAAPAAAPPVSLASYLALGVEHIASGADHLVFLLGLLMLAGTLGEVTTIVTGFTIAHSLTLGLAVLGRLRPEASAVEALIGLSIALVAAENGWLLAGRPRSFPWWVGGALLLLAALAAAGVGAVPAASFAGVAIFVVAYFTLVERSAQPLRLRTVIAFAFGLVHGFGFAGVLAELSLPAPRLAVALLGFNLGVEAGQLAVVAAVWPLLRLLQRFGGAGGRLAAELATGGVAALGVFWLVARTYGAGG